MTAFSTAEIELMTAYVIQMQGYFASSLYVCVNILRGEL